MIAWQSGSICYCCYHCCLFCSHIPGAIALETSWDLFVCLLACLVPPCPTPYYPVPLLSGSLKAHFSLHLVFKIFNRLYLQSSFTFIAKLSRWYRNFLYTCCPHQFASPPPTIEFSHQNCTFFRIGEFILTQHYHSKSIVYITVHSWCFTCYRF